MKITAKPKNQGKAIIKQSKRVSVPLKFALLLQDIKLIVAMVYVLGQMLQQWVKNCVYALPWILREAKFTLSKAKGKATGP